MKMTLKHAVLSLLNSIYSYNIYIFLLLDSAKSNRRLFKMWCSLSWWKGSLFCCSVNCSWRMERSHLCWRIPVCWTQITWTLTPVTPPLWPVLTVETLYTSKGKYAHTYCTYNCCIEPANVPQSRWCLQLFNSTKPLKSWLFVIAYFLHHSTQFRVPCWVVPKPV